MVLLKLPKAPVSFHVRSSQKYRVAAVQLIRFGIEGRGTNFEIVRKITGYLQHFQEGRFVFPVKWRRGRPVLPAPYKPSYEPGPTRDD